MKALLITAAVLLGSTIAADAQPLPRTVSAASAAADHLVQQVDWACGRGWRLNRWGDCVPRRGPPPRHFYGDRDRGWGPPPPPPPGYRRPPPPPPGWGPPPPPPGPWGPPGRW